MAPVHVDLLELVQMRWSRGSRVKDAKAGPVPVGRMVIDGDDRRMTGIGCEVRGYSLIDPDQAVNIFMKI